MKINAFGKSIDAVAIRASKQEGAGTATVCFEAQDSAGAWHFFLKKDNPGARLPASSTFSWTRKMVDVRGIRPVYRLVSDAVEVAR